MKTRLHEGDQKVNEPGLKESYQIARYKVYGQLNQTKSKCTKANCTFSKHPSQSCLFFGDISQ